MVVLIVDDTRTITALLQVYLMGLDLEFDEARNGQEAYQKALLRRPALIISDVQMPVMDGFAFCAAIRGDPDRALSSTPFLLLTSLKDEASREKGRLVGATAFLQKPISVQELRGQVAAILGLVERK